MGINLRWDITNNCKMNCIHCYNSDFRRGRYDVLNSDDIDTIINKLPRDKIRVVKLMGGEPFDSDYIDFICNKLDKRGLSFGITTNGDFEFEFCDAIAFSKKNFTYITFSMDGYRDEAKLFRKNLNVDNVISNIKAIKRKYPKIVVCLNLIINIINYSCIYDVMRSGVNQRKYEEIFDKKAFCWNDSSIEGLNKVLTMDQIQNAGGIAIETVLLLIGVAGLLTGRYEVGGVYALVASVQTIKRKFSDMPVIIEDVYETQSHYQRLAEFCDKNQFVDGYRIDAEQFDKLELRGVSFGYRNAGQIIRKFDYSFCKGGMYAIVGEAGTGKTTVLLLIARLLKETGGSLCYNGKNMQELNRDSLWKQMIYVSKPCFVKGTVEENIRFGRETFDAVMYALIEEYDGKLLSRMVEDEEASAFSAGEKQRIINYRALCSGCSIMLLDEPFSNLDQAMEIKIIELMQRSIGDEKCIIFTTHRGAVLDRCAGVISMERSA